MKRIPVQWLAYMILFILAVAAPAPAADYYVSTTGNDTTGDGSSGSPWKTLTKAANTVPAGTSGSPNTIHVAAGTYDAANGESFPINLNNDYVSVEGVAGGTRIQGAGIAVTDSLLQVDNNNGINALSIQNITFAEAGEAIKSFNGGVTLANNTFEATVGQGLHMGIDTSSLLNNLTESYSLGAITLTGNTFNCSGPGAYIYVDLYFDDTVTGKTATLGGINVSNNTFNIAAGQTGLDIPRYSLRNLNSGTVSAGAVSISNNTFSGGGTGLSFYGFVDDMINPTVTVGNIMISSNTFTNQTNMALHVDYYDLDFWYGTGTASLGSLAIQNNTITTSPAGGDGIILADLGYMFDLNGSVAVTTGPVSITNNTISSYGWGIHVNFSEISAFGDSPSDTAQASLGATTISGNEVSSSNDYGIYLLLDFIGYDMDGQTQATIGGTTISRNTINVATHGIVLEFPDARAGDASDSASIATVTVNDMDFRDNTIGSVTQQGISYTVDATNNDPATETLTIKRPLFEGNTITADAGGASHGIYVSGDTDAGVTFGTPKIKDCTVSGFTSGIYLDEGTAHNGLAGADIQGNTVQNNSSGIRFNSAGNGFTAACNSIVNNAEWGLEVNVGITPTVKAENNWWGDAAGPAACAACNKIGPGDPVGIDFTPWLTLSPEKTPLCGAFPWPMFLPAMTSPKP